MDDAAADVESCRFLCSFISDTWDGHTYPRSTGIIHATLPFRQLYRVD